jgi:hypothetical protein
MNWNHLAEDRDTLYAFVNTVINRCFKQCRKVFNNCENIGFSRLTLVANWYSVSDVAAENRKWNEGV